MKTTIYGYTDIGGRSENEDSYKTGKTEKGFYAVLADGLGGHGGGKEASSLAVGCLAEINNENRLVTGEELRKGFNQANIMINERKNNSFSMKTTAVFLSVHDCEAIWGHIGDSRLYYFYNYRLKEYTTDQSVSQLAVQMGEITRKDIPKHPERSKLIQALGSEEITPIIHDKISLKKGFHAFLLCSDGFWEYLTDDEILMDLHKAVSPEKWVEALRCRIQRRVFKGDENNDNNTAAAVFTEV